MGSSVTVVEHRTGIAEVTCSNPIEALISFFRLLLSTILFGEHSHIAHGGRDRLNESHLKILRKCQGNFDCLVFEMLYIKKFKPIVI